MAGTVKEHLEKYYMGLGHNCAETTFLAANEAWELNMPMESVKMMGGFSGGLGIKGLCGVVSGGVAALSCYYVRHSGHNSPLLMAKVKKFRELVVERIGNDNCSVLGPRYQTKEESCLPTIRLISDILDEVKNMEIDLPEYVPRRVKNAVLQRLTENEHVLVDIRETGGREIPRAVKMRDVLNDPKAYEGISVILCGSDLKRASAAAAELEEAGVKNLFLTEEKNIV